MSTTPNAEELEQQPYDQAKFYTAMRKRIKILRLPASALALFLHLHTICDANTGAFRRDDITKVRHLSLLTKQSVSNGFKTLLKAGLIAELHEEYIIVHYEQDRIDANRPDSGTGYFRLNANLFRQLPEMVAHHNSTIIHLALELLDRGRIFDADIYYGMKTLIKEWHLGSCPSRVNRNLGLLEGIALWTRMPNAAEDGENVHFFLVKDESYTEEQAKYRKLHGVVSSATKSAYETVSRGRTMTWRELARTTRLFIRFGIASSLDDQDVINMASYFGTTCARGNVLKPLSYLRSKGTMHGLYRESKRLSESQAYKSQYDFDMAG